MASVSMTELHKEPQRIIERVAAGETIDITRWGKPVATIEPVYPGAERLRERIRIMGDRWTNESDSLGIEATHDCSGPDGPNSETVKDTARGSITPGINRIPGTQS